MQITNTYEESIAAYKKACFVIFKISFLINSGNLLEELNGPQKKWDLID